MPVAGQTGADDLAVEGAQRGEKRRRAVALVVMGRRALATLAQRQTRLRAVQRLDLALPVGAQDQGALRRRKLKPDDRFELLGKLRVAARLEARDPVWLQTVPAPHPAAGRGAHAGGLRQQRPAPVGRRCRPGRRGERHEPRRIVLGRAPRTWCVPPQASEPCGQKPPPHPCAPLARASDRSGKGDVFPPFSRAQQNPRPAHLADRQGPAPAPVHQLHALGFVQLELGGSAQVSVTAGCRLCFIINGGPH